MKIGNKGRDAMWAQSRLCGVISNHAVANMFVVIVYWVLLRSSGDIGHGHNQIMFYARISLVFECSIVV